MNLFSRAAQNLPLTPAERAFLKLFQNWLLTALGAGITAGAQYALGNQQINFTALAYLVGGAFGLSILSALNKYWSAQGDIPLALAAQAVEQKVEQAVQGATQPPAQQKAPEPIVFPGVNLPQNINATATIPQVQQVQFPPAQPLPFSIVRNPQEVPAVPPAQQDTTRHFGDTGIVPTVQ